MKLYRMARGLGWASIGIGAAELLMPRQVERLLGIGDGQRSGVLRALGVREAMHGFDILTHRNPVPGVWGRVAGDALDAVLLGVAATKTRRTGRFGAVSLMVLGIAAADFLCAATGSTRRSVLRKAGSKIASSAEEIGKKARRAARSVGASLSEKKLPFVSR